MRRSILLGPIAALLISCGSDDGGSDGGDTSSGPARDATVTVATDAIVAEVDPRFISFAVDTAQVVGGRFWAPGAEVQGGGGGEVVDPYDFTRPELAKLAGALAPAMLRIGGSEADRVYYDIDGSLTEAPEPYETIFTGAQFDGVGEFAMANGLDVFFTLNAGPGPRDDNLAWTPDNARRLIEYSKSKGYPVRLWELGNEINGFRAIHGLTFRIDAEQYAADVGVARQLVDEVDPSVPLAGPSSAYWPISGELDPIYPDFMPLGGGDLDVITWHYYPQQSSRCAIASFRAYSGALLQGPEPLDEIAKWAAEVETERDQHNADAPIWLGETGHAQCGGEPGVSETFESTFWWLDELGQMARRGHELVVRQTLSGSNYGLIDDQTLEPRPDYYASLLWRRLMGQRVLDAPNEDALLRSYAHCGAGGAGSVTVVLVNIDADNAARVELPGLGARAELYALTADELTSPAMKLNGSLLSAAGDGTPPATTGKALNGSASSVTVLLEPLSSAFVTFPDAGAVACQ